MWGLLTLVMLQDPPNVALHLAATSGQAGDAAGPVPPALCLHRFVFSASWPNFRWGSAKTTSTRSWSGTNLHPQHCPTRPEFRVLCCQAPRLLCSKTILLLSPPFHGCTESLINVRLLQREETAMETPGFAQSPPGCPAGSCRAALRYFQLRLLETFGAFATYSSGSPVTAPGRGAAPRFYGKTLKRSRVSQEWSAKEKQKARKTKPSLFPIKLQHYFFVFKKSHICFFSWSRLAPANALLIVPSS